VIDLRIRRVDLVDLGEQAPPDAVDVVFIAVRTTPCTGWYGPVSRQIGRRINEVASLIVGSDAGIRLWQSQLCRTQRADTLTSWALGAIDCALWDLRGRLAGVPVAELIGQTAAMTVVRAYASHLTCQLTDPRQRETIAETASDGWLFTKWGLRSEPGTSPHRQASRMAEAVAAAAQAAGAPVAVDAVGTWSPELALAFTRQVSGSATLIWLEDPLPKRHRAIYRQLTAAGAPIAVGERLVIGEDPQPLLAIKPVGLCLDVVGCGGLTRAAAITEQSRRLGIPVYPHGRSLAPGVHLAAAFGDAVPAVEYRIQWESRRQQFLAHPFVPCEGLLALPQAPGLGTTPRSVPCPTS
jgi:L-alanine-DL-glutamate epimerase-like enolase superfamily enzyme